MHVERCPSGPQNFDFDAACQVMSGSCVGLSSSFFRASESNVRHFFDGWFWLGGVWLFRICCGKVGFGCGGAFCTIEFHLSLGHQKVALESFLALRVWLVWARF